MKILVADDDPVSQQILRRCLELLHHEVLVTGDGAEALQLFQENVIDLIISDWFLPSVNGLELCAAIRKLPRRRYLFFILLTSESVGPDHYAKAVASGVDDLLPKPFQKETIAVRLQVAERIINFTSEISKLKTLLPICMYCKKIRKDDSYWQTIETYVADYTGSDLTHGVCPDCLQSALNQTTQSVTFGGDRS